jgi:hypothetical protein
VDGFLYASDKAFNDIYIYVGNRSIYSACGVEYSGSYQYHPR